MVQDILTYLIVGGTVVYILYKTLGIFTKKDDGGCAGSCSCDVKKKLKKEK